MTARNAATQINHKKLHSIPSKLKQLKNYVYIGIVTREATHRNNGAKL
ncbi:hypothetical protein PPHE_a1814 [Pseudoalteromonas phenolica O-BC30]|nr:hypothetical protein [Pseudoalteromonas phenolica O-BC30]